MASSGAIFNAGTNIGSRAESVQISNNVSTQQWFTETVGSRNRDLGIWKEPSKYVVPLSRTYKRVLEIELLAAEFPRSMYTIEEANRELGSPGNTSFRFGEGYLIDDGSVYGLSNDRLQIREYNDPSIVGAHALQCQTHTVHFPRTLSKVTQLTVSGCATKIRTAKPHHLALGVTPEVWLLDSAEIANGKYRVVQIVDAHTFYAWRAACDGYDQMTCDCQKCCCWDDDEEGRRRYDPSDPGYFEGTRDVTGWLYVPRWETPHELASLVQHYVNRRAEPPVCNQYCVQFNDDTGRFVFDRGLGQRMFDLLGSDPHSILPTMGFASVDYLYGSWASQNLQYTILPSDLDAMRQLNPTVVSETAGESALVHVPEGNYEPNTLAAAITQEMQRPLVYCGENDLLVAQLIGKKVNITIPPGMYTPDNLADAIAAELTREYHALVGETTERFDGYYDLECGAYTFASTKGAVFGLLFEKSTIGPLLGFDEVNLTGSCSYTSTRVVYVPVANQRYTGSIYRVLAQHDQSTFRFMKTGQFQSPIISVIAGGGLTRCFTWTSDLGGTAHGLQVGDLVRIEGPSTAPVPNFVGIHVVERVPDAFTFDVAGPEGAPIEFSGEGYVVSHWQLPFFLHFPGVPDPINRVIGFPRSESGCMDYVGPHQWNFFQRCELFLNIQYCSDGEYGRISKTQDSGKQGKYHYNTHTSFVRIPLSAGSDFGLLATSSFARRKRFLFNSVDFADLAVTIVDGAGNQVNFHGRDHCFDIRLLVEQ